MERRLGRTDLVVTPIGLGCWQFAGAGHGVLARYWGPLAQHSIDDIVAKALAGGIDWFDTAQAYGNGASERALAHALHAAGRAPGDVVVATKWFPILRTAKNIAATIGDRISALAPYPIDLFQVHQPFSLSSIEAQMNAMADLVDAKRIRFVGVSNFDADQMRAAHTALKRRGIPLASNQVPYSLVDRRIEASGVLDVAKELGVSIISYSPLAQGLLTAKFHDDPALVDKRSLPRRLRLRAKLAAAKPVVDELKAVGAAVGASPAQVALAWLTQFHGDAVLAIPGVSTTAQVSDNIAALHLQLGARELARLDEVSRSFANGGALVQGRRRRARA
jgi:aryl-alcohol dehydrogenase-like predicted oxidoreductase